MDFTLSDKQVELQETARGVVLGKYTSQSIRETEKSSESFPRAIWEEGIKLGWPGVSIPEEFGGDGGSLQDLCALLEEVGRSGASIPLVVGTGLVATILKNAPAGAYRDQSLSAIASGKIFAPALVDENGRNEWDKVQLPLVADGDDFKLSGKKVFVPFGSSADTLLVTAVTPDGDTAILVVDAAADGVSITRHQSNVGTPLSWVEFNNVQIPAEQIVHKGEGAEAAIRIGLQTGGLLATAEAVGTSEAIKTIAADFVKARHAFGRPIGMFQAVAHPCADMHISIGTIRILTQEAAWMVDAGREAAEEMESTKALANELFERVANDAFCMHGAQGYAEECDLQLFMRRIRGFTNLMGETQESFERAAQAAGI